MLAGHHLFQRRPVALGELRDGRKAVERLGVFGLVGLAVERVVAVEQDAGAGRAEQEAPVGQVEVDFRRFVDRRRHLRGEEAPPNQLVELKEVAFEVFLEIVGRETYFGWANRLMRVLHLRAPAAFMHVRLVG